MDSSDLRSTQGNHDVDTPTHQLMKLSANPDYRHNECFRVECSGFKASSNIPSSAGLNAEQMPRLGLSHRDQNVYPQIEVCHVKLDFSYVFCVDCVGLSGGLALFWQDAIDVHIRSFNRFFIDANIGEGRVDFWRFTGFYGDPNPQQRHNSWSLLRRLSQGYSGPWLCARDFNEILCDKEKQGGIPRRFASMAAFSRCD
ncbi:Endonuclease/exonuclease/phosphatase [Trema orientale]|uniref:Endonuclease/exonuclease/phosphatase n=1 Tax=Trema orientale TaxID=63057 RepID=A0A2P5DUK6_TREOI|nr:Endonuclease/exonuclease/phosphatase [Trema orientale]